MALIICPHCGKPISDQAEQCPHCGEKTELGANKLGTLTFVWKGSWKAIDTDVYLSLNGESVGERKHYSFVKGFNVDTPIHSEEANINIKAGSLNDDIECTFERGKNYVCTFSFNRLGGALTYEIAEEDGDVIFRQGLPSSKKIMVAVGLGVWFLSLAACVYLYFIKDKDTPNATDNINTEVQADTIASTTVQEDESLKLEEFKNFHSKDLSVFLLHGKVKTMTEYSEGNTYSKCVFDENGKLTKYEDGYNKNTAKYDISHEGNRLVLVQQGTYVSWAEGYELKNGRLAKYESGGDGVGERVTYSNYDSNNWPQTETFYEYNMDEDSWDATETKHVKYSDIDKYGNWTKCGNTRREITYYPIQ